MMVTRRGEDRHKMQLDDIQRDHILKSFNVPASTVHSSVWSRRQYAPMHIHTEAFASLRAQIEAAHPEHVIAFDVVFESAGNEVAWHCDYESIGPFELDDPWTAIRDEHFCSVHFNLTDHGGRLTTLAWPHLSYVFCLIIARTGIYSGLHSLFNWMARPLFVRCGTLYSNARGLGNSFNNLCLHSVSSGAPRISYVVRLARRGCVRISRDSVDRGIERSSACTAYRRLRSQVGDESLDVSEVCWSNT